MTNKVTQEEEEEEEKDSMEEANKNTLTRDIWQVARSKRTRFSPLPSLIESH